MKTWAKPKSIRNIQVFLGFANFYQQFIQEFNRITVPLTLIFQTTSSKTTTEFEKRNKGGGAKINNEVDVDNLKNLRELVKIKKNTSFERKFLILKARLAFTRLRQRVY